MPASTHFEQVKTQRLGCEDSVYLKTEIPGGKTRTKKKEEENPTIIRLSIISNLLFVLAALDRHSA